MVSIEMARIAHEVDRAYSLAARSVHSPAWEELTRVEQESVRRGVAVVLNEPGITASEIHEAWRSEKLAQGWVWGPIKSDSLKTHPSMVDFDQLSPSEQAKDFIFVALIQALAPHHRPRAAQPKDPPQESPDVRGGP